MQTDSSARRTCMASASAVEWTATVLMPISRQARCTRSAISPRLAMRTFSNIERLLDDRERFAVLHRRAVLDQQRAHTPAARRLHRVEGLHGLDQRDRLALAYRVAHFDEGRRARLG